MPKHPAQIRREVDEELARVRPRERNVSGLPGEIGTTKVRLKDRYSGGHVWLTLRDGRVVGVMGSDPSRYMGMPIEEARHHARYGGSRGAVRSRAVRSTEGAMSTGAMSTARRGQSINPEYLRKTKVAGQLADDAWLRGGLDAMDVELKQLRRNDADPVIISEFERLYHKQMLQVLPEQRLGHRL